MKVSIIIPIYNVKKYLKRCLNSVLNQTFTDFEVICINDGSTDNCQQILKEYANKDNRIKVINQENQGQSIARNKGLNIAKGEYIFFVDADDFIHKQALEAFVVTAEKTKSPIIVAEDICLLSKDNKKKEYINLADLNYKLHNNPLTNLLDNVWSSSVIWNKLYKKEVIKDWRFIEGIYFEDWCFITCLFSTIDNYTTIPYTLYNYNDYNYSTVRSIFTIKKLRDYETGINFVYNYFQKSENKKYWRIVQKKRISASIKMMINKARKETTNKKELILQLLLILKTLHKNKAFKYKDLGIKSLTRLIKTRWKLVI